MKIADAIFMVTALRSSINPENKEVISLEKKAPWSFSLSSTDHTISA